MTLVTKEFNPPQSPFVRGEADLAKLEQGAPSPDKGRAGEGFSSRHSFIPYNNNLCELARKNRKNPTLAETKIWNELLRNKSFASYKFTRQKPLGSYIADFYCSELRLVIEIDGDGHAENTDYDNERTRFLACLGLDVVRYQNQEVLGNLAGVAADLERKISAVQHIRR